MPSADLPERPKPSRKWTQRLRCWRDGQSLEDGEYGPRISRSRTKPRDDPNSESIKKTQEETKDSWTRKSILSFDGDGIEVISQILILEQLMLRIREIEESAGISNSASYPYRNDDKETFREMPQVFRMLEGEEFFPCHYFDYIGGSGAGGIAAILLGRLRFDVNTAIYHFQNIWRDALGMESRYHLKRERPSSRRVSLSVQRMIAFQQRSQHLLNDSALFSDDPYLSRTLVFARNPHEHDRQRRFGDRKYLLYPSWSLNGQQTSYDTKDLRIWDVASRASLTPFKKIDDISMATMDQKAGPDFPAIALLDEVRASHKGVQNPVSVLVSLGLRHDMSEEVDRLDKQDVTSYWIPGPDAQSQQSLELSQYKALESEESLNGLRETVRRYCKLIQVDRSLSKCAHELVSTRVARSRTPEWERRTLGVYFECSLCHHNVPPTSYDVEPSDALLEYQAMSESIYQNDPRDFAEITRKFLDSVKETRSSRASVDLTQFLGREKPDAQFFVSPSMPSVYQIPHMASPVASPTLNKYTWSSKQRLVPRKIKSDRPHVLESTCSRVSSGKETRDYVFHSRKAFMYHLFDYHEKPLPDAEHKAEIDQIVRDSVRTKLT